MNSYIHRHHLSPGLNLPLAPPQSASGTSLLYLASEARGPCQILFFCLPLPQCLALRMKALRNSQAVKAARASKGSPRAARAPAHPHFLHEVQSPHGLPT